MRKSRFSSEDWRMIGNYVKEVFPKAEQKLKDSLSQLNLDGAQIVVSRLDVPPVINVRIASGEGRPLLESQSKLVGSQLMEITKIVEDVSRECGLSPREGNKNSQAHIVKYGRRIIQGLGRYYLEYPYGEITNEN